MYYTGNLISFLSWHILLAAVRPRGICRFRGKFRFRLLSPCGSLRQNTFSGKIPADTRKPPRIVHAREASPNRTHFTGKIPVYTNETSSIKCRPAQFHSVSPVCPRDQRDAGPGRVAPTAMHLGTLPDATSRCLRKMPVAFSAALFEQIFVM